MKVSRRHFLSLLAATSATAAVSKSSLAAKVQWAPKPEDLLPGSAFRHGVASGDPLHHRVILWTRVTPLSSDQSIPVQCEVASDARMTQVVSRFKAYASKHTDFTVKVDAYGLKPGRVYYYQFSARGETSPIGRTRTLAMQTDNVRLGVCSCSNYPGGFFAAYGHLARKDNLDAIVHLGDYIYELANGTFGDGTDIQRIPEPNRETVSLHDYRTRFAQYRGDPHLQQAHQLHPWIVVWDDHEIANNAYKAGAENHQADEGDWEIRKAAALRAYFEWLPIRDNSGLRQLRQRIFRRFRFGDLLQLNMLDTRLFGREQQVPALIDPVTSELQVSPEELMLHLQEINRQGRQMLGHAQHHWLTQQTSFASRRKTQWNILGQQVMMGQLTVSAPGLPAHIRVPLNVDQWDGYADARDSLLNHLKTQNIDNTIILTGDFHSSWAQDVALNPYDVNHYDPATGHGSQAVEFVTPSISSPIISSVDPSLPKRLEQFAIFNNPHTQYVDLEHNGYLLVDIDRYRARAEYYHLDNVRAADSAETLAAVVETPAGTNHAVLVEGQVASRKTTPSNKPLLV